MTASSRGRRQTSWDVLTLYVFLGVVYSLYRIFSIPRRQVQIGWRWGTVSRLIVSLSEFFFLSGAVLTLNLQDAPSLEQAKLQAYDAEIRNRGIEVGKRCRVGGEDEKRGEVMYIGEVEQIPGGAGKWIGVKLDEPVGRNDGSLGGKRYWGKEGDPKHSVFVRPERVEVGQWPVLEDLEDMEEI